MISILFVLLGFIILILVICGTFLIFVLFFNKPITKEELINELNKIYERKN